MEVMYFFVWSSIGDNRDIYNMMCCILEKERVIWDFYIWFESVKDEEILILKVYNGLVMKYFWILSGLSFDFDIFLVC